MDREIVKVDAKTKAEAIAALKLLLEMIKKRDYDGQVVERILVTNEGTIQDN